MRSILFIMSFVPACFIAQSDSTSKFSFYLSAGINAPLIIENAKVAQPYDAFSTQRKTRGQFSFFVGRRFSSKWSTFIGVETSSLGLKKDVYLKRLETQYTNSYVYDDFGSDATNSSGVGLKFISLSFRQMYHMEKGKIKMYPSLGFGLRYMKHRDFSYVVRSKQSNSTEIYRIDAKRMLHFVFSPEMAFSWKESGVHFFVKTDLGRNGMKYSIQKFSADALVSQESYKLELRYIPLLVGFRINGFNEVK